MVARAVLKRRREFTTARWCARTALARLGVGPVPILPGDKGAPTWPEGIVGSMTHCVGYRAAAVARTDDIASIGVDAEPNAPLPAGVLDTVTGTAERQWLRPLLLARPEVSWDRLVFSAKESVYKAWFPLMRCWLGFDDVIVTVDAQAGTFHARLLVPGPYLAGAPLTGFTGRWQVAQGLMTTAISLPSQPHLSRQPHQPRQPQRSAPSAPCAPRSPAAPPTGQSSD